MPYSEKGVESISLQTVFAMLEASYDGLTYTDETGRIRYFNVAYTRITGITKEEMLGQSIYDMATKGYPISNLALCVFETRETISQVIRYRHGSPSEALVTVVPLHDADGTFRGIVGNIRDITGLIDLRESLSLVVRDYAQKLEDKELENQRLREQISQVAVALDEYNIVGKSRQMRALVELAHRISNVDSTVLITGESGVGKDVFCKMIHKFRGHQTPYTKISCGAIPEALLESELFGYEPGAFTGASKNGKPGIFEIAETGTVFLDEIGEMPLQLQVKLLTVLQDRRYYRLGGTKEKKLNARIIAASNKDLREEMEKGRFRRDLFYRLNVIPVHIPPLRERQEDILPLANHLLNQFNKHYGTRKTLSPNIRNVLLHHSWPGNIRELNNVIEHMCVLSVGDVLDTGALPEELQHCLPEYMTTGDHGRSQQLKTIVERFEASVIHEHLSSTRTLQEIAQDLGIDISTLVRKIKKYNLPKRYKQEDE